MNPIVEQWVMQMIVAHVKNDHDPEKGMKYVNDHVHEALSKEKKDIQIVHFNIEKDYCCAAITDKKVYVPFRGTDGTWGNNLDCLENDFGFHSGWYSSFMKKFREPLFMLFQKFREKEWSTGGHSRGCPLSLLFSYNLSKAFDKYCKPIMFCPPRLCTVKGELELKRYSVAAISVIDRNDIVDNVGVNGFAGVNYGDIINLKDHDQQDHGLKEVIFDHIPESGHAYTEVNKGLIQYFYNIGMEKEAEFLKSMEHHATI
jgi:hypothetical protein